MLIHIDINIKDIGIYMHFGQLHIDINIKDIGIYMHFGQLKNSPVKKT